MIPIYNEDYDLVPLDIRAAYVLSRLGYKILFIDDNTVTATAGFAQYLSSKHPLSLLFASGKGGLPLVVIDTVT